MPRIASTKAIEEPIENQMLNFSSESTPSCSSYQFGRIIVFSIPATRPNLPRSSSIRPRSMPGSVSIHRLYRVSPPRNRHRISERSPSPLPLEKRNWDAEVGRTLPREPKVLEDASNSSPTPSRISSRASPEREAVSLRTRVRPVRSDVVSVSRAGRLQTTYVASSPSACSLGSPRCSRTAAGRGLASTSARGRSSTSGGSP